jgi:hypothetical protein
MTMDVYVEVHDFGFGPACGFLDMTERFAGQYRWHVLAVGNVAAYIRKERPGIDLIPFDGYHNASWPHLHTLVPRGAPVVTFSNPGFAAFAAREGYRVYFVDQLDWMWSSNPEGIDEVQLHLIQYYFGRKSSKPRAAAAIEIRPIVTPLTPGHHYPRDAAKGTVVGLGGMAIASDPLAGDSHARWLLPQILKAVGDRPDVFPICVVGGSPNLVEIVGELGDSRVFAAGGVGRRQYMELLRNSRFQILTPGLASIYEAAAIGISPLFQPGVNKSMLLQLESLAEAGYPFTMTWPWFGEARDRLISLPPEETEDLIARSIASSMRDEDEAGNLLRAAVENYISSPEDRPLPIDIPRDLPEGATLLERALLDQREKKSKKFGT